MQLYLYLIKENTVSNVTLTHAFTSGKVQTASLRKKNSSPSACSELLQES